MLSPFLVSPPKIPYPLHPFPFPQRTHSHFPAQAFPYTGEYSLHRPKGQESTFVKENTDSYSWLQIAQGLSC